MKNITIIVPKNPLLGCIESPRQIFTQVNKILNKSGNPSLFKISFVGLDKQTSAANGSYIIKSDYTISDYSRADLVIIPALEGNTSEIIKENKAFIPWIKQQYDNGSEVASLCMGAFILAATGLVNGKECATHWSVTNEFRKMFPFVTLVEHKIITYEDGIYTSGGAFSSLNLILYIIQRYAGRQIAVLISKIFQIDLNRANQSQFIIFKGQKNHEDEEVKKLQNYLEENVEEKISIDDLTVRFSIGRRNLERRFKKATGNTILEYMQRVKVEAAKLYLESSRDTITDIMYKVGYTDNKNFRMTFKKYTGLTPAQYRSKFYQQTVLNVLA
jgi:transcriptional regulator GlxA family with amidase domain